MAEVELLGAAAALGRHRDDWRRIAVERWNAFATPEWFEAWLRHYGTGGEIEVAVVSEDGRLLGLIPLVTQRSGPIRVTKIAGAGLADLLHPVAPPAAEAKVAGAVIADLLRRRRCGAFVLDNVDADASWWHQGAAGLRLREQGRAVGPYASLEGLDFAGYLRARSSSFRKQLLRFERRLDRQAAITLRQSDDPERLPADLATFLRLHFERWEQGRGSSLDTARAPAFLRTFAAAAHERGWLRLLIMEADEEPIAAFFGWRIGGRFAFYQSGFDQAWRRFSVGLVLHGKMIARAIAEGAAEYDMLLGGEAYKDRFCDAKRNLSTVALTRSRSPSGLVIGTEIAGRRFVRALPEDARDRVRSRLSRVNARLPTGRRR